MRFYTSISLAVSSFTDRKAIASAGIILPIFVSGALVGGLVESGSSESLVAFNLFRTHIELAGAHEPADSLTLALPRRCGLGGGWTAAGGLVTWWRYRRLPGDEVTHRHRRPGRGP